MSFEFALKRIQASWSAAGRLFGTTGPKVC